MPNILQKNKPHIFRHIRQLLQQYFDDTAVFSLACLLLFYHNSNMNLKLIKYMEWNFHQNIDRWIRWCFAWANKNEKCFTSHLFKLKIISLNLWITLPITEYSTCTVIFQSAYLLGKWYMLLQLSGIRECMFIVQPQINHIRCIFKYEPFCECCMLFIATSHIWVGICVHISTPAHMRHCKHQLYKSNKFCSVPWHRDLLYTQNNGKLLTLKW